MVHQTLESPTDLLPFQLRTALTMENDWLGELAKAAKSAEIKKLFRHHADEPKDQIANLQQVFHLLELKESTCAELPCILRRRRRRPGQRFAC